MATDISKVGNVIQINDGVNPVQCFVSPRPSYSFNAAGTSLYIRFSPTQTSNILLSDLRVQGAGSAPADAAAALTALSTSIFP